MTGVHNNPNVGGVNNAQGAGVASGADETDALGGLTAADFGLTAGGVKNDGSVKVTVIPAGNEGAQTKGPQLTPQQRANMLRNIANLDLATAADSTAEGVGPEATSHRAVAFASTLADFHNS